MHVSNTDGRLY